LKSKPRFGSLKKNSQGKKLNEQRKEEKKRGGAEQSLKFMQQDA
jgi:hypothetical protein